MNFRISATLSAIVIGLAGCATSTMNYAPPVDHKVQNSKFVARPFDAVWDSLVKELSRDFFIINNIDRNSRLINISFSSQRPSDFVDCGNSHRTFKNVRGEQNYIYKTSDSVNFVSTDNQGRAFIFRRNSRLEGRTNVYVAPEREGTNITVNTKYVVSVTISATTVDGRPAGTRSFIFDPTTTHPFTNGEVRCVALGLIEERILRAAQ